jgi:hypothetical protein
VYPALIPDSSSASGFLISDLSHEDWRLLDAFEDDIYELRCLTLQDGRRGWAYVATVGAQTTPEGWDVGRFLTRHLAAYVDRCVAWRQRHDAWTSAAQRSAAAPSGSQSPAG